jgi:dienelactone hydrolase
VVSGPRASASEPGGKDMRGTRSFLLGLAFAAGASALAEPLVVPFTITKPAGDGPFPAVVIMHDCSGLGPRSSGAPWRWSAELLRAGYVTIWPDSFSTRGHPNGVCTEPNRTGVQPPQRVADAYAALRHLHDLPYVDAKRVAVMGGSHGGSTTLATIVATEANTAHAAAPQVALGFAAAIALYPGCRQRLGDWVLKRNPVPDGDDANVKPTYSYSGVFKPLAPTLILTGELDDWTPAEPCQRMTDASKAAGLPVEMKVYPGAHHSFDSIAAVRTNAERINPNAAGGRGATTGGNAEAWADARKSVVEFLGRTLVAGR